MHERILQLEQCNSSESCKYCCMDGYCRAKSDCDTPFVNSFAFVIFLVLVTLTVIIFLFYCIKKRKNKEAQQQQKVEDPQGVSIKMENDNKSIDSVPVKNIGNVLDVDIVDEKEFGRV